WQLVGLCLLGGCQTAPPSYPTVQVSRTISGNSIEWVDKSQQPPMLQQGRLIGIDAPDLGQEPWGKQAKQRLEELIGTAGKGSVSIELDGAEADKYGRKYVYLWKDGRLLNQELIEDGYVLAITRSGATGNARGIKYRDRFIQGSQYARIMGVGIWNPERPMRMSPSQFRKEER
uniref:thermonuclease family protein n=1 Tax=Chamaesiphon sp. OTE_20_metabat_361 TaxID=2964689 RepID=UPI00286B98BE